MLVYKIKDETLFMNYQPILLLPAISKICVNNKQLYYAQYGFRSKQAIEYAAIQLVDRLILEMNQMNKPVSITLYIEGVWV